MEKRIKKRTYNFVFTSTDESKTAAISGIKGEVLKIIVILPNWTNTVTAIVTMNNSDSKEIFKSSVMAQNDEYDITLSRNEAIIVGADGEEWKITLSGAPGGSGGTATIIAYVGN